MTVIEPISSEPQLDYYHILGIKRNADINTINTAYRTLALKLHPYSNIDTDSGDNTNNNQNSLQQQYINLCESYIVLTNHKLRGIYDQYGYHRLRHGSTTSHRHGIIESFPCTTLEQSNQLFLSFFGTNNPFSVFSNHNTTPLSLTEKPTVQSMPTQYINLYVTLDEINTGCTKLCKVYTQTIDSHTNEVQLVEKVIEVTVGAGYRAGTKITFPGAGDSNHNCVTGDIVFVICEKLHPLYTRKLNDLIYKCKLTLLESLTGKYIELVTLDQRKLHISLYDMICTPYNNKIIANEGLPHPKHTNKRGNMIIEFIVEFPPTLTVEQQTQLKRILE